MMNEWFILVIVALLLLIFASIVVSCIEHRQELSMKESEQQYMNKNFQELEEGIESFLERLELPQLEGQTKRQEIAHQLSIVLIEKLLLSPVPCCIPSKTLKEE